MNEQLITDETVISLMNEIANVVNGMSIPDLQEALAFILAFFKQQ